MSRTVTSRQHDCRVSSLVSFSRRSLSTCIWQRGLQHSASMPASQACSARSSVTTPEQITHTRERGCLASRYERSPWPMWKRLQSGHSYATISSPALRLACSARTSAVSMSGYLCLLLQRRWVSGLVHRAMRVLHSPDIRLPVPVWRAVGQGRAAPRQPAAGALMHGSAGTILSLPGNAARLEMAYFSASRREARSDLCRRWRFGLKAGP